MQIHQPHVHALSHAGLNKFRRGEQQVHAINHDNLKLTRRLTLSIRALLLGCAKKSH